MLSQMDLSQLQHLVESGIWRENDEMWCQIYIRFCELAIDGLTQFDKFGGEEFWQQGRDKGFCQQDRERTPIEERSPFEEWLEKRNRCFVNIYTNDNMVLPRAVVTAIARLHKDSSAESWRFWEDIRKSDRRRHKAQQREATHLMERAKLQPSNGQWGIEEMQKIQAALPEYRLRIWNSDFVKTFDGNPNNSMYNIYLFEHNNHFRVITSMAMFFGKHFWCDECETAYGKGERHLCIM